MQRDLLQKLSESFSQQPREFKILCLPGFRRIQDLSELIEKHGQIYMAMLAISKTAGGSSRGGLRVLNLVYQLHATGRQGRS